MKATQPRTSKTIRTLRAIANPAHGKSLPRQIPQPTNMTNSAELDMPQEAPRTTDTCETDPSLLPQTQGHAHSRPPHTFTENRTISFNLNSLNSESKKQNGTAIGPNPEVAVTSHEMVTTTSAPDQAPGLQNPRAIETRPLRPMAAPLPELN